MYSDHHRWLCGWLRQRLGNGSDAADLAQDTFVRVLGKSRTPGELSGLREPRAWLATIARGLVIDHVRRQAVEQAYLQALVTLPAPEHPSPEARCLLIETLVRIDAMLDGLNPKARSAFLLSRLEGMGHAEIATHLGLSLSSVEKHMATAIRHCLALREAE